MNIHFVGGDGGMGRLYTPLLQKNGHRVICSNEQTSDVVQRTQESELTLLATPLATLQPLIKMLGPHAGALVDLASVKEEPLDYMRAFCRGEYMSLHPLYGPDVPSIGGRIIALSTTSKPGSLCNALLDTLQQEGAVPYQIAPDVHDRVVCGVLQNLRARVLHAYGSMLLGTGMPFRTLHTLSPPPTQTLIELLARQSDAKTAQLQYDIGAHHAFAEGLYRKFAQEFTHPTHTAEQIREAFGSSFLEECQAQAKRQLYA